MKFASSADAMASASRSWILAVTSDPGGTACSQQPQMADGKLE
jgi:hypothetical protein